MIKKVLLFIVLSLSLLIGSAWSYQTATPEVTNLPLPKNLVDMRTPQGANLLSNSRFKADHKPLMAAFETQSQKTFCGVATTSIFSNTLMNSERAVNQNSVFGDGFSSVMTRIKTSVIGLTLEELSQLMVANGLQAQVIYASDIDLETFRETVKENLTNSNDLIAVNYQRSVLGQTPSGHISPLAAYNESEDAFLILDVASYKYPPVWVSAIELYEASITIDGVSGKSRGLILVSK